MSDSGPVVSFDRSSPVHAYWLANCEGFRVRAGGRRGVVEEVELGPVGHVSQLVVGYGLGRHEVVSPTAVVAVVPAEEVLVLHAPEPEPSPPRLEPVARRTAAIGKSGARAAAAAATLTATTTRRASGRGSRVAWTRLRGATAATSSGAGRFTRWSTPRLIAIARRAAILADAVSARLVAGVYAVVCSARANVARFADTHRVKHEPPDEAETEIKNDERDRAP